MGPSVAEFRRWPGDTDYIDAVQAPGVCFENPRWRSAVFEKDMFEIPIAATGRSAIVFQAKVNSADVALRFFTRSTGSQKGRYEKLNAHLKELSPPGCFVGFAYYDEAILVGGTRYPLVEMTWSKGVPLNQWIGSHRKRSSDLAGLAASWHGVVNDLWTRQIAHGDLANDNCLVNGSGIDLIDYDSCYIPALAQEDPGEAGNIHFQHPMRDGYYELNMDAFPALVIYLSVLALSRQKSLWEFYTGDNLIFTAEDYKSPQQTRIWTELGKTGDREVTLLTGLLAEMCAAPIASLPPLSQLLATKSPSITAYIRWWEQTAEASPTQEPVAENQSARQAAEQDTKNWWEHWSSEWREPGQTARLEPTRTPPAPTPPPPAPRPTPPISGQDRLHPPDPGESPPPPAPQPVAFGLQMKRRNPVAAWIGLPLITLGIYHLVWYYKIHNEMAKFDRRQAVPTIGPVLVLLFLCWTVIAPLRSYYNAGNRIRNAQRAAGLAATCSGAAGMLLMLVLGVGTLYYQAELNKIADQYRPATPDTQVPLFV